MSESGSPHEMKSPAEMKAEAEVLAGTFTPRIHQEGAGILRIKVPPGVYGFPERGGSKGQINVQGFDHGRISSGRSDGDIRFDREIKLGSHGLGEPIHLSARSRGDRMLEEGYGQPNDRQVVIIGETYSQEDVTKFVTERRGFLRKKDVQVGYPEKEWRPTGSHFLSINTPQLPTHDPRPLQITAAMEFQPALASELFQAMQENPYLPSALFESLWPDIFHGEGVTGINRYPISEVMFFDRRTDPNSKGRVIPLPEQITF